MFYAHENQTANSRERLTRAVLQVPNSTPRRFRRLCWSRQKLLSEAAILRQPTPLANPSSGYNKNPGCDSRRGSSESINTCYLQNMTLPFAIKQPAVRGSAGRRTGTVLLLIAPLIDWAHSATVMLRKVIALKDESIRCWLRCPLPLYSGSADFRVLEQAFLVFQPFLPTPVKSPHPFCA
jgi:hypothetical protein